MENKTWMIEEDYKSVRIDKFLVEFAEDLTRSRIQGLIEEGHILVNGKETKANYKLRLHDEVTLVLPENEELDLQPEDLNLDVVYEDHDVIVINKPKGMVVHPAAGNQKGTLVNGLLYHCTDLSGINGTLRPGIVHRIDKDTTGLIIAAKNDQAHLSLAEQLQSKTVSRHYYALVHGVLEHDFGTIDAPIGRDPKDRQKMCVTASNSKNAVTHFKVVERFKKYTLVECRLETGRTHQIRVHMQYIKHPIVGDQKYSYRKTMDCNGQLLHAFELTFIHPRTQEKMVCKAPLPKEYQDILDMIRQEDSYE